MKNAFSTSQQLAGAVTCGFLLRWREQLQSLRKELQAQAHPAQGNGRKNLAKVPVGSNLKANPNGAGIVLTGDYSRR